MRRRGAALILILLMAPARDAQPSHRGMMAPADDTILSASRAIDWTRSAGLFIGVQRFHRGSDLDVPYAVDDAVDLACAFTRGPHRLLRPTKAALLIAGLPFKESSRARLAELRRDVMVIEDARGSSAHDFDCLNEETIVSVIRQQARSVGPAGVLVLSVATHGVLIEGEHRLLTADASADELHGISLARILRTVQEEHVERILLFIDACRRKPDHSLPSVGSWQPRTSGTFLEDENLRLSYAVLVGTGPGGRSYADEFVGNGYFSRAVVEGLECTASARPDGWLTLVNLESYVSKRVLQLSHGFQQTASRIGGFAARSV